MLSEAGNRKVEGEDGTRRAVVINGCVNIMKKTHSRWCHGAASASLMPVKGS